jgi:hypothetical protein
MTTPRGKAPPVRTALLDVQHGRRANPANWLHRVC